MTCYEAISIFNEELKKINKPSLKTCYNKDELKKSYNYLLKVYHPDVNKNNTNEVMQYINKIYAILKTNIKNNNRLHSYFDNNLDLENLKENYIRKMKEYSSITPNDDTEEAYNSIISNLYFYEELIKNTYLESNVLDFFNYFKDHTRKIYEHLKNEFFIKYFINNKEVSDTIVYDLDFKSFYEQLLKIKNKYSPIVKIEEKENFYKVNDDNLNRLIKISIENAKKKLSFNTKELDQIIYEMEKEIKDLTDEYYDILTRIENIKSNNYSTFYFATINNIEKELKVCTSLSIISKILNNIEQDLFMNQQLNNQRIKLNTIYAKIMNKISNILNTTDSKEYLLYNYINTQSMRISNIFNYVYENIINIEDITELENLTFYDQNIDNYILNSIEDCLLKNQDKSKQILYIKFKNFNNHHERDSIYMLLEDNKIVRWNDYNNFEINEIEENELNNNFEPIDNLLNNDRLIWKKYQYPYDSLFICYLYMIGSFNDSRTIALIGSDDNLNLKIFNKLHSYEYLMYPPESSLEIWKDKEFIKLKLIEQINNSIIDKYPKRMKK